MESKNVLLIFKKEIMYKPIIYRLAKDFDIKFNVLEAKILAKQEGRIILALQGTPAAIAESISYLEREGVDVDILADKMSKDENRCIHCGACVSVCRVDALVIERPSMEVKFYPEKCVACGLCKIACPVDAMKGISIDLDD